MKSQVAKVAKVDESGNVVTLHSDADGGFYFQFPLHAFEPAPAIGDAFRVNFQKIEKGRVDREVDDRFSMTAEQQMLSQ